MVDTHDPKDIIFTVGGAIITGFATGTFLKVSRNQDSFTFQPNVDGGGTRSMVHDRSGRFEFTLSRNSDANQILSTFNLVDEQSGAGAVPVMVKDNRGTSLHLAESGWVVRPADAEYADEATGREWIIETDNLVTNVGGLG